MPDLVIDQRRKDLGNGFEVGRVLPFARRRMVGPFIFFDHMGPVRFEAGLSRDVDVRPHPHIGLATVTYLFDGEIMHRDSVGSQQPIRPREVNWMVAGSGITHSERFEKARTQGDRLHGIQAWVALPNEAEETDPAFSHHAGDDLPAWEADGVRGMLIAGTGYGLAAGVPVCSPMVYAHLQLADGASAELPAEHPERAVYVATGGARIGGQDIEAGQMAILSTADDRVTATAPDTTLMVLGGEPVGERHIWWNLVSSSTARLRDAAADWKAGRFKLPDADDEEWIPLPDTPLPQPDAMS